MNLEILVEIIRSMNVSDSAEKHFFFVPIYPDRVIMVFLAMGIDSTLGNGKGAIVSWNKTGFDIFKVLGGFARSNYRNIRLVKPIGSVDRSVRNTVKYKSRESTSIKAVG